MAHRPLRRVQAVKELELIRDSARPALRLLVFALGGAREAPAAGLGSEEQREKVAEGGGREGRGDPLDCGALRALFDNLDHNELMWSMVSF